VFNQLYKVSRKEYFSAGTDCSSPEKVLVLIKVSDSHSFFFVGETQTLTLAVQVYGLNGVSLLRLLSCDETSSVRKKDMLFGHDPQLKIIFPFLVGILSICIHLKHKCYV
jgi:hypothetical protein